MDYQKETRRTFIAAALASPSALLCGQDAWTQLPAILKRIQAPSFPNRVFDVTRYGAKGDGKTDCTEAFRRAITECSKAGGGHVSVPPGDFLSAAIHLLSNVDLNVSAGATIRFDRDPRRYLPVVYPFIYRCRMHELFATTLDGPHTSASS